MHKELLLFGLLIEEKILFFLLQLCENYNPLLVDLETLKWLNMFCCCILHLVFLGFEQIEMKFEQKKKKKTLGSDSAVILPSTRWRCGANPVKVALQRCHLFLIHLQ